DAPGHLPLGGGAGRRGREPRDGQQERHDNGAHRPPLERPSTHRDLLTHPEPGHRADGKSSRPARALIIGESTGLSTEPSPQAFRNSPNRRVTSGLTTRN